MKFWEFILHFQFVNGAEVGFEGYWKWIKKDVSTRTGNSITRWNLLLFHFQSSTCCSSKFEYPCNKFWLSQMRLKELNSKFSKTTGLETEADFRVWGHYIFGKAGIRSCNPLVRLSLGCKKGTRRNGRFGLPSRQAPSGNRHQCPFR